MIVVDNILYSYGGHDMKLVKFDIICKETDCWVNLKSHITCFKLIKYRSKKSGDNDTYDDKDSSESTKLQDSHIAAAFSDFDVVLYDLDLNQII